MVFESLRPKWQARSRHSKSLRVSRKRQAIQDSADADMHRSPGALRYISFSGFICLLEQGFKSIRRNNEKATGELMQEAPAAFHELKRTRRGCFSRASRTFATPTQTRHASPWARCCHSYSFTQ